MTYYYKLGKIPPKRHIQFRDEQHALYQEELVSSKGFSGVYSILYHKYPPTAIQEIKRPVALKEKILEDYPLQPIHLKTSTVQTTGQDYLDARKILLKNNDCAIGICNPELRKMDYFYKNGEADELVFVHEGSGYLISQFGRLRVVPGDYVVIPRTTVYKFTWDEAPVRLQITEIYSPIETVSRYRNELGQLLEHSPYCERDIRPPEELVPDLKKGEHRIKIKKGGLLHEYVYHHSPLDIVGWDGYLYPYALSIKEFEPITGRIHQPPPVHQTFQAHNLVVCSFVPRLFDYHPLAIPAPYNHSNIDSDEVLYYVEGNFMSRKGIDVGSFTLHPGGIPHGPHPGTIEKSIGAKETKELAVMIDTFKPLYLTETGLEYVVEDYPQSWLT